MRRDSVPLALQPARWVLHCKDPADRSHCLNFKYGKAEISDYFASLLPYNINSSLVIVFAFVCGVAVVMVGDDMIGFVLRFAKMSGVSG
jgi:hypothetical protein